MLLLHALDAYTTRRVGFSCLLTSFIVVSTADSLRTVRSLSVFVRHSDVSYGTSDP